MNLRVAKPVPKVPSNHECGRSALFSFVANFIRLLSGAVPTGRSVGDDPKPHNGGDIGLSTETVFPPGGT